jgi:exodeoxyribonuclease V alpha subunit
VIVDETSMVSLTLMARLVEAVRPDARLVLVGDPGQLTSIEAGAVLGDIVGPAATGLRMRAPARRALERATGRAVEAARAPDGVGAGDGIVVLDRSHRFGAPIATLADAVRRGDGDATIAALRAGAGDVGWIEADLGDGSDPGSLAPLRAGAAAAARAVTRAAAAGDAAGALEAIGSFRLLCAHRRGPHGASTWRARIEGWLAAEIDGFAAQGAWYVGRPLLVTENDYGLRLYNGDTGVVVADPPDGRVVAAFERRGEIVRISPARLGAVDTVYAMTIHKAQGSQFETAAVVLPPASSPIMTRELLYTAVTRARTRLVVAATEDAVRAAVGRPVARASGLRERLWGDEAGA